MRVHKTPFLLKGLKIMVVLGVEFKKKIIVHLSIWGCFTFTRQAFSKRIEITPQIHIQKFEEHKAWG